MQAAPPPPPEIPSTPPDIVPVRSARALAVLSTLLVLLLYVTVGAGVQQLNVAFGVWFTEIFVFFAVGWVMLRRSGRPPLRYTHLDRPRPSLVLFGFALGVANFFAFVVPIQYAAQALAPESWKFMDVAQIFRFRRRRLRQCDGCRYDRYCGGLQDIEAIDQIAAEMRVALELQGRLRA